MASRGGPACDDAERCVNRRATRDRPGGLQANAGGGEIDARQGIEIVVRPGEVGLGEVRSGEARSVEA